MINYPRKITDAISFEKDFLDNKTLFGLPSDVKFCLECVISNQRPASEIEYLHTASTQKKVIKFHEDGICDACKVAKQKKEEIDWSLRENELWKLCDKYRGSGEYDCIVPGSGGKDSFYTSHILKYKFNMNPLTITWAPHMYTEWGIKNMENWSNSGFDNYLVTPNRKVQKLLTRLALENLFHPFQPFQFGQKFLAPKLASKLGIKLIFYGENQAEYGNDSNDLKSTLMNEKFFSVDDINEDQIHVGGESITNLKEKFGLSDNDLKNYLPMKKSEISNLDIKVHYLSHYLKWHPQSNYYYAVKNGNFVTSPNRMPGTYTKFISIDDKMEDFNYYTTGIKYGLGWTSYTSSVEVRDGDLTRDEALALVKKYDLEFPTRFANDFYEYLSINKNELPKAYEQFEQPTFDYQYFMNLHDKFRSPHIWKLDNEGNWKLRKTSYDERLKSNSQVDSNDFQAHNWKGNKKNY